MENLDHDGFNIPDETSLSLLMSIYGKACQDPFPLHAVCGSVWRNVEGQLSLLRHVICGSAPPDVFTFAHSSRHMIHSDSFQSANKEGNQAWSCLDLLEVLCELAERGHGSTVRTILEQPLNQCHEVLLAAIAHISRFLDVYTDPNSLLRIVDICQELKPHDRDRQRRSGRYSAGPVFACVHGIC